jgi:thioredoxin 1
MANDAKYVTLTDNTFENEVIESNQPVLVDFWATWCPPCKAIAPTIEELAGDYEGRAKVAKLDVDDNPATAARFNVRSIPTLRFFQNGKVVDQIVGSVPKHILAAKLDALAGVVKA